MTTTEHCNGCYDDFYNGAGATVCWNLAKAKLVPRLLIHIDQAPPYKGMKPQMVPDCYRKQRYVTVKSEDIAADGYWRHV